MKNIYVSAADLLLRASEHEEAVHTLKINHKTLVFGVAGVPGRGDHQGHARGRQHVHLLTVRQEGPR